MDRRARAATTGALALAIAAALTLAGCDGGDGDDGDLPGQPTAAAREGADETAGTTAAGRHVDNPYAGATMYVNDVWSARVLETAEATDDAALGEDMRAIADTPTAVWMDRISAIDGNADGPGMRHHLDAAVEQAGDEPVAITVVIYDLPGRDCFALASQGELPASDEGLERYTSDYIDVLAAMFDEDQYRDLRIVTVIEPDSLPNLVTNASEPACQAADPYYRDGVAYALDAFAPLEHVYAYIDAAHSGWLGWDSNAGPSAQLFADVVRSTSAGFAAVDGFVTNTANYTPLEEPFLTDPELQVGGQAVKSGSFYEFNPVFDEADWTADLHARLVAAGFPESIGMLIDTSRNGWGGDARPAAAGSAESVDAFVEESRVDRRAHRGAWCNQDGAGLGRLPQALPAGFPDSHLDAFVWVKPPGESDGASTEIANDQSKGLDRMCDPTFRTERLAGESTHALPDAPVSGQWFASQFEQLVANAYPEIGMPVPAPRDEPGADAPVPHASRTPGAEAVDPPDASAGGCTAELVITNEWQGGFQADVTVTATGAIDGWQVELVLPSGTSTDSLWNGEPSGTTGAITVTNADWNGTLARGQSDQFGFTAAGEPPSPGPAPCTSR